MCNLSWTPHSNLEKDNSLNHACVSPKMGCLEYTRYAVRIRPTLWEKITTRFNFTKTSTKPCTHLGKPVGHCSVTKY